MATTARLEVSVTNKGILQTQRALDRLKNSAQKAKSSIGNLGKQAKLAGNKALTGLEGKVKQFSSFLNGEGSSAFSKIAGRVGKLVKSFGAMKAAVIAVIALQLAKWLKAAASAAIAFDEAIANIATLIPDQITKVREYSDAIEGLAITYAKSQNDIANATYQTISAFGDLENTFDIVDIAAQAATAGVSTTADAVNLLSAVSKAYNDTSSETIQKISDLSFTAVRLGQTTFPELASSIGTVTPLANSLGVSLEELFTVFSTLTGVTGTASEVSTQFRSILTALVQPTTELSNLYEKIGVSSGQAFIESQGGAFEALQRIKLEASLTGNELASYLGRVEGLTAALALTGAQQDVFTQKLNEAFDSYGATVQALEQQINGVNKFGFQLKQLGANARALVIDIGEAVLPFFSTLPELLNPVIDIFKSLFNAVQGIGRLLRTLIQPFTTVFTIPVKLIAIVSRAIFDNLGKALTFISDLINGLVILFKRELAGSFEFVMVAIKDLTDNGFFNFIDSLDASTIALQIFEATMITVSVITVSVATGIYTIITAFQLLISTVVTGGKLILNVITGNFEKMQETGTEFIDTVGDKFKGLKTVFGLSSSAIRKQFANTMEDIKKETFSSIDTINAYIAGTAIKPLAPDSPSKAVDDEILALNKTIGNLNEKQKLLGDGFDANSGKVSAFISSIDSLNNTQGVSFEQLQNFIKRYPELLALWDKSKEKTDKNVKAFSDLETEFVKQLEAINELQVVYGLLGIEFDAINERSDLFNKTLQDLAENGNISTEQVLMFAEAFAFLNQNVDETETAFQKALNAAKDFGEVLQEGVFNALNNIEAIAPDIALSLSGIVGTLTTAGIDTAVDGFKELGKAFSDGAVSGREFQDIIAGQFQALLDLLPSLFIQTGLSLIAANPTGNLGIGLGFIAAGLTSSFVGGLTQGIISDTQSQAEEAAKAEKAEKTANAMGNVYEGNIVPFKSGGAFTNSIVDTPTNFRFAKGTGLMGEAGAEGILPLARTQSGDLGVKSVGGGSNVTVIVNNNSNAQATQTERQTPDGKEIEVLIQNVVEKTVNEGKLDRTFTNRFNTDVRGVG